MTLKTFFASPLRVVLAASLLGALAGVAVAACARTGSSRFEASIVFTLNQTDRQKTADYAYDGYYALKASELFADTLISWFKTPAFVAEAYGYRSDAPDEAAAAARIAAGFRAKKLSSQTVAIFFRGERPQTAAADAQRLIALAVRRASEMNQDAEGRPLFMLTTSEPIVVDKSPAPARAAFAGFLAGAFLAAGLLFVFAPATSLASHDRSRNDVASDVARQRQE